MLETADEALLEGLAGILEHGNVLVLTGAGISTDSGIPDYRGPDGLRRVQPMQHGEFVGSSVARQRYWARSYVGWRRLAAAEPNAGHLSVARLQRLGYVASVITQNVDGLHQRAGSTGVVELHGSLAEVGCLDCDAGYDREAIQLEMMLANPGFHEHVSGQVADGSRVSSQIRPDGDVVLDDDLVASFAMPTCGRCGSDRLKPDVVFFGGSVPRDRVAMCFELTEAADALLVIGSSLAVMSGLRFVRAAARRAIPVAILTRGPTRGDDVATLRLDASIAPTLAAVQTRWPDPVAAGPDGPAAPLHPAGRQRNSG